MLESVAEGVVVLEDGLDKFGTPTFHDEDLPFRQLLDEFGLESSTFQTIWVFRFYLSREIIGIPLVHWQFVILFALHSLSDVAPGDLNHKNLLGVADGVVVVHDEAKALGEDLLQRHHG